MLAGRLQPSATATSDRSRSVLLDALVEQERGERDEERDQDGFRVLHEQHDQRDQREDYPDPVNHPGERPAENRLADDRRQDEHDRLRPRVSGRQDKQERETNEQKTDRDGGPDLGSLVETHLRLGHRYRGVADVRPRVTSLPTLERREPSLKPLRDGGVLGALAPQRGHVRGPLLRFGHQAGRSSREVGAPAHAVEPATSFAERPAAFGEFPVELDLATAEVVELRLNNLHFGGWRRDFREAREPERIEPRGAGRTVAVVHRTGWRVLSRDRVARIEPPEAAVSAHPRRRL